MSDFSILPSVHEVDRCLLESGQPFGAEVRCQVNDLLKSYRQNPDRLTGHDKPSLLSEILIALAEVRPGLQPVINGTGTIIHTNLGRSILSKEILASLEPLFSGYCDLEYSTQSGKRGQRTQRAEALLCQLTGAESALLVNNNAAAVMLCLHVLAPGKEVLLSRGELVEIGGSFRVPDILESSGAKLKELGTTNKTRIEDYQKALSADSGLVLKVHRSNFKITGFTSDVPRSDLALWAKQAGLPMVEDLGSGSIESVVLGNQVVEPGLKEILAQGVPLVTASGDKLLGGPQAGLILGRAALVKRLRNSPMYRCLRCDKITLHLLEQTLLSYARKQPLAVPTYRMLHEPMSGLKRRATQIIDLCPEVSLQTIETLSTPGGGSLPGENILSIALEVQIPGFTASELHQNLRVQRPSVVGRISKDRLLLDMRTLLDEQVRVVASALRNLKQHT